MVQYQGLKEGPNQQESKALALRSVTSHGPLESLSNSHAMVRACVCV